MSDKIDIGVCEDLDGDDDFGFFRGHRIMRLRGENYKEFTARVRRESAVYHRAPERIAELEAEVKDQEEMFGVQWGGLVECPESELTLGAIKVRHKLLALESARVAELEAEVERLRAALDAWLDWDRTAETDTSGAILERARAMTDAAPNPPAKETK